MLSIIVILLCIYAQSALGNFSVFPQNFTSFTTRDLSPECSAQLNNLNPMTIFTMLDASSKIPNGLMSGSLYDLANFDECYNIDTLTTTNEQVYGKYCLGTIPVANLLQPQLADELQTKLSQLKRIDIHPIAPRMLGNDMSSMGYHFALCIPNKCTPAEINPLLIYYEDFCYSKDTEPEFTTGPIITSVFFGIMLTIALLSTLFDIYLYYSKKDAPHELMIAFSFLSNGRKLFKSSSNPDQLLCLNGIRAISMMWVIVGHEYSIAMTAPLSNFFDLLEFQKKAKNMWMLSATVSVDTFFLAGGLVTVYTFLKASDKGVKFNIVLYYVHRFLRLSPALGATILIYANLIPYLGNGPLWSDINLTLSQGCVNYWYTTFFYFSNFYHKGIEICVPQSWYLSVDIQLFLLSPIILIALMKWKKIGLGLLGVLSVWGIIIPFIVSYIYEINPNGDYEAYNYYYYAQTHTRFAPYVMGMFVGYLLFNYKKNGTRITLQPVLAGGIWIAVVGGLIACLYAPYNLSQATYDKVNISFYLAFWRPAWSLGVLIVIYLCVTGYGSFIDGFLSLPIFQFLTKISYSMYLVHFAVISIRYFGTKITYYFSDYQLMTSFWGDFMFTAAISVVLCLLFESPIIILEKYLFGRGKPNSTSKNKV